MLEHTIQLKSVRHCPNMLAKFATEYNPVQRIRHPDKSQCRNIYSFIFNPIFTQTRRNAVCLNNQIFPLSTGQNTEHCTNLAEALQLAAEPSKKFLFFHANSPKHKTKQPLHHFALQNISGKLGTFISNSLSQQRGNISVPSSPLLELSTS